MNNALIITSGNFNSIFVPSLIYRLNQEGYDPIILSDDDSYDFLNIQNHNVFKFGEFFPSNVKFSKLINLSTSKEACESSKQFKSADKNGFYVKDGIVGFYNKGADLYFRTFNLGVPVNHNAFQLMYGLCNLTWKGEGYNIKYRSTNSVKYGKFIDYSLEDCSLNEKFEIISEYEKIETSNIILAHIALGLKKKVRLVLKKDLPYKFELFKSGEIIKNV